MCRPGYWPSSPGRQEDNSLSFGQLRDINPDVCGWLTLDGTAIDYPVVQGESNFTYLNTDVYGGFALAGEHLSGC